MQRWQSWTSRAVVVLGGALMGCVGPTTPAYDSQFGHAVRQARQAQTLNEPLAQDGAGSVGLDGVAARAAITRYQESFRTPPKSFDVLNIGGTAQGVSAP